MSPRIRKKEGSDKSNNELLRALMSEEMKITRVWVYKVLRDIKWAESLTAEVLNCTVNLLHKDGNTSDKPSDWRPIGLLNVCMQLLHHIVNYRMTVITEVKNILVSGQDGERGAGVDLNQIKLN